jgi:1,4-dihydroxy-6-naphthoate synthase
MSTQDAIDSRLIRVGHSPDPDDAFMFYGLKSGLVTADGLQFEDVLADIQSLNEWAHEGRLEVTAVSVHAYAYLADKYRLLPHGASMGEQYGPIVVAREPMDPGEIPAKRVAIPGKLTSAFLELELAVGRLAQPIVVPFDEILETVARGDADAGLVIHEGQLTYEREGLQLVLDLGLWWHELTGGLPLPLGANAIRRDLDDGSTAEAVSHALRRSIEIGLRDRDDALEYAEGFGRGLDRDLTDRFVGMYVNQRTLDYGDDGRQAVAELLDRAFTAGLVPARAPVDFVRD